MRVSSVLIASLLLLPLLAYGRLFGDRDLVVCEETCGVDADCDDGNDCTKEACDTIANCCERKDIPSCTVCTTATVDADCTDDDTDLCITSPTCEEGVCRYEPTCIVPPDQCGFAKCDAGVCSVVPGCSTDGDCGRDDPCNAYECDKTSGCCQQIASRCDDGNPCTVDTCDPGTGECKYERKCTANVDDPCVVDDCDKSNGQCGTVNIPDGQLCKAGVDGVCSSGACVECVDPSDCDDENSCTTDTCTGGVCSYADNNGALCEDGDKCTENDTCLNGSCQAGSPVSCDDGDPCTVETCRSNRCEYSPKCATDEACDAGGVCCKTRGQPCDDSCSGCCSEGCRGPSGRKSCK